MFPGALRVRHSPVNEDRRSIEHTPCGIEGRTRTWDTAVTTRRSASDLPLRARSRRQTPPFPSGTITLSARASPKKQHTLQLFSRKPAAAEAAKPQGGTEGGRGLVPTCRGNHSPRKLPFRGAGSPRMPFGARGPAPAGSGAAPRCLSCLSCVFCLSSRRVRACGAAAERRRKAWGRTARSWPRLRRCTAGRAWMRGRAVPPCLRIRRPFWP